MAHAQKPDLVFQRNGRVHLNRRGCQFSSTTGSRGVRISGQRLYRPCSDVQCKVAGYPLHSHLSPSLPLPCVTVCHQVPNALYQQQLLMRTPRLPVVDWTNAPADLNGLVRFAERRNLVSARMPSHFNWPLPVIGQQASQYTHCLCTSLELIVLRISCIGEWVTEERKSERPR